MARTHREQAKATKAAGEMLSEVRKRYGANLDEDKCYDSVCRNILFPTVREMGVEDRIADSQERLYAEILRAFEFEGSIGPWWGSQTSIFQGCALSQIWINAIGTTWALFSEQEAAKKIEEEAERRREWGGTLVRPTPTPPRL